MSERGADIDFDFFDEPETEEEAPRQLRSTGRGPRRPVRPPAGFTPLVRLVGLIAFAILIVVLLVFWVGSCRSESKRTAYEEYMAGVRELARDSEEVGTRLNTTLTTPGIRLAALREQLNALAQRQQQGVGQARELDPPAPLRDEHENLVQALEFRVGGLKRLGAAFEQTASVQGAASAGELLSTQVQRLVASDVIWDDAFRAPAMGELRKQEIGGVDVPDSTFLKNPVFATEAGMTRVVQRIRGASTGGTTGGRHGNALLSVRALPDGDQLQVGADNTVVATAGLAFEVTVENQGDSQEVRVPVILEVEQTPRPLRRTETIQLIDEGEQAKVVFEDLGQVVQFAQETTVRVQVVRVKGEQKIDNNSASYSVIFTLVP